jgi:hypothetical protein
MTLDLELESWRADWREGAAPLVEMRQRVRRQRVRMIVSLTGEGLLSIVWLSTAVLLALRRPSAPILILAAGIWAFVGVAMTFSIWNSIGAWRPAGESVRDFVELARERYLRDLRAVRFGMALLLVMLVFTLGWTQWTRGTDVLPEMSRLARTVLVLPILIPTGTYLWLRFWRRRALRELALLDETRRHLETSGEPSEP